MKRQEPRLIGQIIDRALAEAGSADEVAAHRIEAAWGDVVGQGINRMTYRRVMKGSVLHIYMTSAVLKHDLSFRKQSLIESLCRVTSTKILTDIQFH